jgi:hypothetical protein
MAKTRSISEIVAKARHIEITFSSLRLRRKLDVQSTQGVSGNAGNPQKSTRDNRDSHTRNQSTNKLLSRSNGKIKMQMQQSGSKPVQTSPLQTEKGNTSKLTCYKCGQSKHISTNPKCPQYKKPTQCQMFAAQVIDDRLESNLPNTDKPSEGSKEIDDADPESEGSDKQDERSDPDDHTDVPDGSKYDDCNATYEEYDGYETPLEDDGSEVEYIRTMCEDSESYNTPLLDDADWRPQRNAICVHYECAPWVPHDALKFTPQYSITHTRGCDVYTGFKEHIIVAKAIEGDNLIA